MIINSRHWQDDYLSVEIEVKNVNDETYFQNDMIRIEVLKAHWLIGLLSLWIMVILMLLIL